MHVIARAGMGTAGAHGSRLVAVSLAVLLWHHLRHTSSKCLQEVTTVQCIIDGRIGPRGMWTGGNPSAAIQPVTQLWYRPRITYLTSLFEDVMVHVITRAGMGPSGATGSPSVAAFQALLQWHHRRPTCLTSLQGEAMLRAIIDGGTGPDGM